MRRSLALGALALLILPLVAQAMTVEEFLARAAALRDKGAAAPAPELDQLRDEIRTAAEAYRAVIDSARATGGKPRSCPPPKGQAKIDSATLIAAFQKIPRAQRGTSVRTAFFSFMDKRYPCR